MRSIQTWTHALVIVTAALALGCSKKKTSDNPANLPILTPSVKAATPTGLQTGSSLALTSLAADFKERFFTAGTGPTNIYYLVSTVDGRIAGLNTQTAGDNSPCVTQAPVAYTITVFGQSVPMYAQCYDQMATATSTNPGFVQFGVNNGITYLYSAADAFRMAAVATPITGQTGYYKVQAWFGLGYGETSLSEEHGYGVMQITADPAANSFEFALAGLGLGYCGAQMRSDGKDIYFTGSQSQGGCQDVTTLCTEQDASTTGTCGSSVTTFAQPPLGRTAVADADKDPASLYPSTPTITLNGTTSDDLYFGPSTPTAGAGDIQATKS